MLAVVGPCSIHDLKACREYAEKFAELSEELKDRLLMVMRVYFEKPRTTVGWKGLIMDPQLNGTCDIPKGLRIARTFLGEVLDFGIPLQLSSSIQSPLNTWQILMLGCNRSKDCRITDPSSNGLRGFLCLLVLRMPPVEISKAAVNGIAATQSQTFLGITEDGHASAVTTGGNPDCQLILRGGADGPNYTSSNVEMARIALDAVKAPTSIMIDCSHANSSKEPSRQPDVLDDVLGQIEDGADAIHAVMVESHLKSGSQAFPRPADQLDYGVSITDGCIDWNTTEACLRRSADVVDKARSEQEIRTFLNLKTFYIITMNDKHLFA